METREDRERGADSANLAGGWSYEDQVAANESLEVEPLPPLPEDPAWTRQKERMSAEQRSFVTTAVWSSSGLLWGKCTCCDKWIMDVDHFKSKSHLKKTGQRTETAARAPEIKVFYPSWFTEGSRVDGAFLVDSFYYMKDNSDKKVEYLPTCLDELH